MANPEHLAQAKKGSRAWNRWRGARPKTIPDLSQADLAGADLQDSDLSRVDLEGANLTRANLENAVLDEANLGGANLNGANLIFSKLAGVNAIRASFSGSTLQYAELRLCAAEMGKPARRESATCGFVWCRSSGLKPCTNGPTRCRFEISTDGQRHPRGGEPFACTARRP
jgi:hypothetical protein